MKIYRVNTYSFTKKEEKKKFQFLFKQLQEELLHPYPIKGYIEGTNTETDIATYRLKVKNQTKWWDKRHEDIFVLASNF